MKLVNWILLALPGVLSDCQALTAKIIIFSVDKGLTLGGVSSKIILVPKPEPPINFFQTSKGTSSII